MSATASISTVSFFLDALTGRILGRAYLRAASERSRVCWIRLNGLLLPVLCALVSFALGGRA